MAARDEVEALNRAIHEVEQTLITRRSTLASAYHNEKIMREAAQTAATFATRMRAKLVEMKESKLVEMVHYDSTRALFYNKKDEAAGKAAAAYSWAAKARKLEAEIPFLELERKELIAKKRAYGLVVPIR